MRPLFITASGGKRQTAHKNTVYFCFKLEARYSFSGLHFEESLSFRVLSKPRHEQNIRPKPPHCPAVGLYSITDREALTRQYPTWSKGTEAVDLYKTWRWLLQIDKKNVPPFISYYVRKR